VRELEPKLREFMERAELFVADLPGPEVVVDGVDPRTPVLIDALLVGPEDEDGEASVVPEQVSMRVFLYALNVLRSAAGLHAVQQCITDALRIELGAALADLERDLESGLERDLAQAPDAGEGSRDPQSPAR
jgi:hypothetical protein